MNNTENQTITHPEDNGAQPADGKTFTQDEVNRIVQERLARERARMEQPAQELQAPDQRELDLAARENKLSCMEFINGNRYDTKLLEILDTSDSQAFQTLVEKLVETFPEINPNIKTPRIIASTPGVPGSSSDDLVRQAFRPKV